MVCLRNFVRSSLALLAIASLTPAHAAPVTGDDTFLFLDPDFLGAVSALEISASPWGNASFGFPDGQLALILPITGGTIDFGPSPTGTLAHEGSGFSLTRGLVTVYLTNPVITFDGGSFGDPTKGFVLANVGVGAPGVGPAIPTYEFLLDDVATVQLFEFSLIIAPWSLTPDAAAALTNLLIKPGETAPPPLIGTAFSVVSVPEPGSWALLIAGFAVVGVSFRRRRLKAA